MTRSEVKKIDSTKRQVDIEVEGERVKSKFEEVFAKIAKEAKVPGFRPGHAPRDILEKHYSSAVHEQVLKELIPDIYNEVIAKECLDVVELPEITEVKLDRLKLTFTATVDISPEMKVEDYKGIKVKYEAPIVGADDIKRYLDSMKESRKLDVIDDGFAKSIGYPSLADLEKSLERQIFVQKENQERQKMESQIIEKITKDMDFKLPASLLARQLQEMLKQAKLDLALKGVPRAKIDEQENPMLAEFEPEAKKQVKTYLVMSAIAKKENIPVDDNMPRRVIEFLLKNADWKTA
ncbi:MAG: trigger factor [Candidatus Omnitrophota bacterium]|nr:trigger factor [Candidatus Omnitrophota bacterium]